MLYVPETANVEWVVWAPMLIAAVPVRAISRKLILKLRVQDSRATSKYFSPFPPGPVTKHLAPSLRKGPEMAAVRTL